ncbi:MAG: permease prefix domain 1-containing protein [Phycisphaerales bacterium]
MSAAERLKLVPHKPTDSGDATSLEPSTDSILQTWLNAAVAALPTSHQEAIQNEIEDHITEHVRELTLAGENEHHALARALQEFGNPAVFTRSLARARRAPFRRLAMNSAIIAASGIALITSLVAVTQPAVTQPGATRPLATEAYVPAPKATAVLVEQSIPIEGPMSLTEALERVAKRASLNLIKRTAPLGEQGIDLAETVRVSLKAADVADAFDEIRDARGLTKSELDYRVHNGVLEVATRGFFDARETRLVSIDAGDFLAGKSIQDQVRLHNLITELVEPEGWADNGGTTARLSIVGNVLFVKAPPRYIEQIQWIVAKLNPNQPADNDHAKAARVPILKDLPIVDRSPVLKDVPIVEGNLTRDPRLVNDAIELNLQPAVRADSVVIDGLLRSADDRLPIENALTARRFVLTAPATDGSAPHLLIITSENGNVTIRSAEPNPPENAAPAVH